MTQTKRTRVLLVDDEAGQMEWLAARLVRTGLEVTRMADPGEVPAAVARHPPDVVLLDLHFPGDSEPTTGERLRAALRTSRPYLPVVVFTTRLADATLPDPDLGPDTHFFSKTELPGGTEALARMLRTAIEESRLRHEVETGKPADVRRRLGFVVGRSAAMRQVALALPRLAATTRTVLITGEPGTGKELVARALHNLSPRAAGRFVVVECGSGSKELLFSELFGHEKGAFTGAGSARKGAFEAVNGGTLFVTEVLNAGTEVQDRLMRVLEKSEIQRLGAAAPQRVDARMVAASNRTLTAADGLREDLRFVLTSAELRLPALRDRLEDLPELFEAAVEATNAKLGTNLSGVLRPSTLEKLQKHPWPGNVRELFSVVARVATLGRGNVMMPEAIEFESARATPSSPGEEQVTKTKAIVEALVERVKATKPGERYALVKEVKNPLRARVIEGVWNQTMGDSGEKATEKELVYYLTGELDQKTHDRVRRVIWEALKSGKREDP